MLASSTGNSASSRPTCPPMQAREPMRLAFQSASRVCQPGRAKRASTTSVASASEMVPSKSHRIVQGRVLALGMQGIPWEKPSGPYNVPPQDRAQALDAEAIGAAGTPLPASAGCFQPSVVSVTLRPLEFLRNRDADASLLPARPDRLRPPPA